ncbi:MAG: hypothetical protein JSS91_09455 [Bacteroidetes bacterium]|nr:hypothetical protein [Bacteroidota bacterium]
MKSYFILITVMLTFLFGSCGLLSKKYTKTGKEIHTITAAGKKKIRIENVSGNINFVRSSDSSLITVKAVKEVQVKKKYLDTPFDELSLDIDTAGNEIVIKSDFGDKNRNSGFQFGFKIKTRIDYDIYVPEGIDISAENVNGNITAGNLSNSISAEVVNGDVDLKNYSGIVQCEITNGSFSGQIDSTNGITVNIINGRITLHLNNFMNARVNAQTVNGKINTEDLNFTSVTKEKKLLTGILGQGEPKFDIRLETVNGKISLLGKLEI